MAPIPEDNQEKPPPRDDEDLDNFSSGNMAPVSFGSDSSDENDENYPDTAGYTLLPQEPGADDSDDDRDNDNEPETIDTTGIVAGHLPEEVIQSEGGVLAPTVVASSTSLHPEFLAKFPDGKVPSYMQVPDIPLDSKDLLWNKRRLEQSSALDTAEEKNIIKAMSGFSLPLENVPDWAKNMSEDQWNNVISQQIGSSQPESVKLCQSSQSSNTISVNRTKKQEEDWIAEFPDS